VGTWPDGDGVVVLPSGRRVRGRAIRRSTSPAILPQFGVYLLAAAPDSLGWEHTWVRCRDFGCPTDPRRTISVLHGALERAGDERVEVGCGGGVGRTGIALAVLAMLDGVEPEAAVDWVRRRYHPRAVETPWQRRWVRRIGVESIA
jgi:protein-tyrosine phosphatase